ncbi:hypothetical protein DPMN_082467 [Dreissena polymorpha]|uniref:Uncharacterized protein n=1 Tax=Dreissena polymorpha TaxID=45954 RepID=A0A9D4BHH7_DREPO|nr:hypothetical protein DPMN_082467 [Dreissena polymorpha]
MDMVLPDRSGFPQINFPDDPWNFGIFLATVVFQRPSLQWKHEIFTDNPVPTQTTLPATRHQNGTHTDFPGTPSRATNYYRPKRQRYG